MISNVDGLANSSQTKLTEARKLLGTVAIGMDDHDLLSLLAQIDTFTDIVIAHYYDSNIQSSIDISSNTTHND